MDTDHKMPFYNFVLNGNDLFNSGVPALSTDSGGCIIFIGGGVVARSPTITNNSVYEPGIYSTAMQLGYSQPAQNVTVVGNYLYCYASPICAPVPATYTENQDNSLFWRQTNPPSQNQVFVRPNAYEAGRANITVFNWQRLASVPVDVSSVRLMLGQGFKVVDTQNVFGPPVLSGVYAGGVISLPDDRHRDCATCRG